MPKLGNTLGSSNNIRKGAVDALASLYQRIMQSVSSPSRALKPYSRGPVVDALASMCQRMIQSPSSSSEAVMNRYGRGGGVVISSPPNTFSSSNASRNTHLSAPLSHTQAHDAIHRSQIFRDPDPRIFEHHEFGPSTQQPRLRIPWENRLFQRWYASRMRSGSDMELEDIVRKFHSLQPFSEGWE